MRFRASDRRLAEDLSIPNGMTPERNRFQPTKAKREALSALADYFCLNGKMAAELLAINERSVQRHYAILQRMHSSSTACRTTPRTSGTGSRAVRLRALRQRRTQSFHRRVCDRLHKDLPRPVHEDGRARTHDTSRFHLDLARLAEARGWTLRWRQRDPEYRRIQKRTRGRRITST